MKRRRRRKTRFKKITHYFMLGKTFELKRYQNVESPLSFNPHLGHVFYFSSALIINLYFTHNYLFRKVVQGY